MSSLQLMLSDPSRTQLPQLLSKTSFIQSYHYFSTIRVLVCHRNEMYFTTTMKVFPLFACVIIFEIFPFFIRNFLKHFIDINLVFRLEATMINRWKKRHSHDRSKEHSSVNWIDSRSISFPLVEHQLVFETGRRWCLIYTIYFPRCLFALFFAFYASCCNFPP